MPGHLGLTRALWLVLAVAVLFPAFQEAVAVVRGPLSVSLAAPRSLDLELAKTLLISVVVWIVALAWTYPRALTLKSHPAQAVGWYLASFALVFFASVPGASAASNHQRHGLALCCHLANLALLLLMYPRAEAFPDEAPPPPAPTWDGALEIKHFACPHCGARTFGFANKLQMRSNVLYACRKCRAWVTVPWLSDGLQWLAIWAGAGSLPWILDRLPIPDAMEAVKAVLLLPIALTVILTLWGSVVALVPLVTRFPPPPRSTAQHP
jgi:hypothetical protein